MPDIEKVTKQLEQDLAELRALQAGAQRSRVQQVLLVEVRKLETELLREKERLGSATGGSSPASQPTQPRSTVFKTKITDYAWDQSDKFVKLYITLPGVHEIPSENVKSVFGTRVPKPEMDSGDPSASLMNMMKQMYDEGDDEMKRTIAKAWTEARDKQQSGGRRPGGLWGPLRG
ncbi:hypothetical protein HPB48_000523 [Haemaphysalis longicornis]|uniref:Calcyclin-binding protein n=1 Tax=Haemaphysalis longicornis TaxID=44386 RepID=A0A9J6GSB2_HAELO|nr:hypothetical protein HPB48_000523 [Haemaphysalis longicornis]